MMGRRPQFKIDFGWLNHLGGTICTVLLWLAGSYFVAQLVRAWWLGNFNR